jgi:hypothetical protein
LKEAAGKKTGARCRYAASIRRLAKSTSYEAHRSRDTAYYAGYDWAEYFTRSGRRGSGFVLVAKCRGIRAGAEVMLHDARQQNNLRSPATVQM